WQRGRGGGVLACPPPRHKEEAVSSYRRAQTLFGRLTRAHPDVLEFALGQAATTGNLAMVLRSQGKSRAALACYNEAIPQLTAVFKKERRHGMARTYLWQGLARRADILTGLGQHDQALNGEAEALRPAGPAAPPSLPTH